MAAASTGAQSVVVVGGGISGLAAGLRLVESRPELQVSVLEGAARAGGLIGTQRVEDCLVELGPDSILTEKPSALDLARRVGITDQVIGTNPRERGAYVVHRGRLERIPEGFSMMAPSRFVPVLTSPILSLRGKLRLLGETLLPRGSGGDESVGSFVRRRFGKEVLARLAQPLMGGIYGTDVETLSLAATMPRFIALETEHRSVTLGLLHKTKQRGSNEQASGVRYGLFISFQRGMQTLVDAVAARLGERLELASRVSAIRSTGDGRYRVERDGAPPLPADQVVLALPAREMARLVHPLDAELAASLLDIPYGSSAAVYYCFRRGDVPHPLDAFGFVVPKVERSRILASTWASVKFAGRAPEDRALLRVFFGGDGHEDVLELSDEQLVRAGRTELSRLLAIQAAPLWSHVSRYPHAMPKYLVGHRDRVARIERLARRHPGLELAGNALYGVGIPDAIRSGELAAERVLQRLRQAEQ